MNENLFIMGMIILFVIISIIAFIIDYQITIFIKKLFPNTWKYVRRIILNNPLKVQKVPLKKFMGYMTLIRPSILLLKSYSYNMEIDLVSKTVKTFFPMPDFLSEHEILQITHEYDENLKLVLERFKQEEERISFKFK